MDLMWWSLIVGAVGGIIISVVFDIYSVKTATSYTKNIFGIGSTDLITDVIFLIVAFAVVVLTTMSGLIRDLTYPIKNPAFFSIEVLLMALPPAFVFLLMTYFRGYTFNAGILEKFVVLILKFGIFHILLQFSGFYSSVFPPL